MTRGIAGGLAALLLAVSLGAAVSGAAGASPELSAGPGEPGPWGDAAPERWIVGNETLENIVQDVGQRWRVLPGARLTIQNSTLRFQALPGGLTGLVAEPGSEVRTVNSVLQGAQPGAFLVHLEGASLIEGSRILGALRVVLQPRSVTDHGDDALGPHLEGQALGWRVLRAHTAGIAKLARSTIEAEGPGLVLGVPEQYQVLVPEPVAVPVPVVVEKSTVRAAGPGVVCYVTRQQPDPDATSLLAEALARKVPAGLTFPDVQVEVREGPALHCPPQPTAYTLPRRNVPAGAPPELGLLQPHLPAPPAPEAVAGLGSVKWLGGRIAGGGAGVVVDTPAQVQLWGPRFEGLAGAVRVAHEKASVELVNPSGSGLAQGLEITAGALDVEGGVLAGSGAGVGLRVLGGSVFVQRLALQGFALGASLEAPADLISVRFRDMPMCALVRSGATIDRAVFDRCGDGVVLDRATGAAVWGSSFVDNLDPLRVESPDAEVNPQHFDHFVANNRVNGKPLVYLFRAQSVNRDGAGHVVIAHSSDVRIGQLDLSAGSYHVHASGNVLIGALTNQQVTLLRRVDPALVHALSSVWMGVRFELYPGALKGPIGSEQQSSANDVDKSWLLIEKIRSLNYEARFVRGFLFAPTDAFLNWTGFSNIQSLKTVAGCSCSFLDSQGTRMVRDHYWIEVMVGPGLWLELDASFGQFTWKEMSSPPNEHKNIIIQELRSLLDQTDAKGGTAVRLPFLQGQASRLNVTEPLLSAWMEEALSNPNATGRDIFGGGLWRPVAPSEEPIRSPVTRFAEVPEAEKWSIAVRLGSTGYVAPTASLYGKRISVASAPETEADDLLVQDAGGLTKLSRSSVKLRTDLLIEGQPVARVGRLHPGDLLPLQIDAIAPGGEVVMSHDSPIYAGGGYSVVLDIGRTPPDLSFAETEKFNATLRELETGVLSEKTLDNIVLPFFQIHGWYYFSMVHIQKELAVHGVGVFNQPLVGAAVLGLPLVPALRNGVETVAPLPPYIDVASLRKAYARDGNQTKVGIYSFLSGLAGSQMEGTLFTHAWGVDGISTVHLLQEAARVGQPLHFVAESNMESVLSRSGLPPEVRGAIREAVSSGRVVFVHDAPLSVGNWTGVGWSEFDLASASTSWFIFGSSRPLGSVLVGPRVLRGGLPADTVETINDIATAIDTFGRAVVRTFGDAFGWAQTAGQALGIFKAVIFVAVDIYNLNSDPNTPVSQAACAGAIMAIVDVVVAAGPLLLGQWIFPECFVYVTGVGVLVAGPFALAAGVAFCALLIGIVSLIITLLGRQVREKALQGAEILCRKLLS